MLKKFIIVLFLSSIALSSIDADSWSFEESKGAVEDGVKGRYLVGRLDDKCSIPAGQPWSLSFAFKVDEYPDGGVGRWDKTSPMTLFKLDSAGVKSLSIFGRLNKKRLFFSVFEKGQLDAKIECRTTLKENSWFHVLISCDGKSLAIYLDGKLDGMAELDREMPFFNAIRFASDGGARVLKGGIDEVKIFSKAISADEAKELYQKEFPQALRDAAKNQPSFGITKVAYPALQVKGLHPLIDQLHINATNVAWYDIHGRDMLVLGSTKGFGARLAIHKFLGMINGVPIYDNGKTVTEISGQKFLARNQKDGNFRLYAQGWNTPFGNTELIEYRNLGKLGEPKFSAPKRVTLGGKSLNNSVENGYVSSWQVVDVDGDEVDDLLVSKALSSVGNGRFPFEGSPWNGKEQTYAGPGKGYDARNEWLGTPATTEILWAKGSLSESDELTFSELNPITFRQKKYPLLWKGYGSERAMNVINLAGKKYLLLAGNVDELMAFELINKDGEIRVLEPTPMLKSGYVLRDTYYPSRLNLIDFDLDGQVELLIDGNPGVAAILRGDRPNEFINSGVAQLQDGDLAAETLTSPWRFDLDDDKIPDLITGDASGYLTFWKGTNNPAVYESPKKMLYKGEIFQVIAGMTGSIQGPTEKRWGYLKVSAGKWNGKKAIFTNDIEGRLMVYNPGENPLELVDGIEFTFAGEPFRAAWRSRMVPIPPQSGFSNVKHDSLIIMDFDGDAAVAIPKVAGGTDFAEIKKLRYADGQPVRLCGPTGLWGRAALELVDWDKDGNLDLLVGTNSSCQKFFSKEAASMGATPFFLRNIGSNSEPLFAPAQLIKDKNGNPIELNNHNATLSVTDLDGDDLPDLIIGAENGKVYYFYGKGL